MTAQERTNKMFTVGRCIFNQREVRNEMEYFAKQKQKEILEWLTSEDSIYSVTYGKDEYRFACITGTDEVDEFTIDEIIEKFNKCK